MTHDREWRRGWPVAVGSALALGTAANLHYYVSTFFVGGITADFGWSRGDLAGLQALALWGVLAAPLIGLLVDRVGLRPVMLVGMVLLAAVYLGAAFMPAEAWAVLLAFLLIQAVGQATGTIPHTKAIAAWFRQGRGLALGVAITGIPAAGVLVSPVLSAVIEAGGWRHGYLLLAGLTLFVGLPAAALLVRDRPTLSDHVEASKGGTPADGLTARQAFALPAFWLLMVAMVLINVPGGGFLNQLVPLLTDGGLPAPSAALMVSVFSGAVVVGRLLSGFLLDRLEPAIVAAVCTLCPVAGMGVLLLAGGSAGAPVIVLSVALIGLQQGAELDLLAYFTARLCGRLRYGFLYGIGYAVSILATSAGVYLFAEAHDLTGSYRVALFASVVTFALAVPCFALLRHAQNPLGKGAFMSDGDSKAK